MVTLVSPADCALFNLYLDSRFLAEGEREGWSPVDNLLPLCGKLQSWFIVRLPVCDAKASNFRALYKRNGSPRKRSGGEGLVDNKIISSLGRCSRAVVEEVVGVVVKVDLLPIGTVANYRRNEEEVEDSAVSADWR